MTPEPSKWLPLNHSMRSTPKCSLAPALSLAVLADHLAANSDGVIFRRLWHLPEARVEVSPDPAARYSRTSSRTGPHRVSTSTSSRPSSVRASNATSAPSA